MTIELFRRKDAEATFDGQRVARIWNIEATAMRKLAMLNRAIRVEELRIPPNNRLEALKVDRKGHRSTRINNQWRLCSCFAGKRAVTVGTGLRLSRYFGVNDSFWTGRQLDYDTARVQDELSTEMARITPLQTAS